MTVDGTSRRYDVIVIGGGHNGLVCAAYLAMDGLRVLVLERRATTGGPLAADELAPGVRAPLVNSVGRLRPRIARELRLTDRGLRLVRPDVRLTSLVPDGPPLSLWADTQRTVDEVRTHSPADAEAYAGFDEETRAFGAVMARINGQPPPDVERVRTSDLITTMRLWFGYRGLGARRAREFLRVLPMALADHLDDNFESQRLQAALAWRGVRYTSLAASDAGSTQVFLSDGAGTGDGAAGEMVVARGGPAALSAALTSAAEANGAEIRTGAEVAQLNVRDGRTNGVVLSDGEEISGRAVVSGLDPKRTLLELVDPAALGPMLGWEVGNLRLAGGLAAVQLVLDGLPTFSGVASDEARQRLAGRLLVAPDTATLDRAADAIKAGRMADTLVLEATIPTLVDGSLVDEGAKASHVMGVLVHGAPYHLRDGDWDGQRDALADKVVGQLEAVAPGLRAMIVERRVLTPLDLERDYGLTEGHALHGEPSLDQWFAWRPMFGHARYRMPLAGLYLCGSGAHPGGGVTGAPGQLAASEVLADLKRNRR